MRSLFGLFLVGLTACTNVGTPPNSGSPPPESTPPATPTPTPTVDPTAPVEPSPTAPTKAAAVTVQMTAATLADDCGGPPAPAKAERSAVKGRAESSMAQGKRACQQSSMQLSVVAAADGAVAKLAVKKVELFDGKSTLIGELTARAPSVWDADGVYQVWDESVAPGQALSVSYALSEPSWGEVTDRRARSYVIKAVITVGDGEQAVQREVRVEASTILPPDVRT